MNPFLDIVKKSLNFILGLIIFLAILMLLAIIAKNLPVFSFLFVFLTLLVVVLVVYFKTTKNNFSQQIEIFASSASMKLTNFFSFSKESGLSGSVAFVLKIILLLFILWLISRL